MENASVLPVTAAAPLLVAHRGCSLIKTFYVIDRYIQASRIDWCRIVFVLNVYGVLHRYAWQVERFIATCKLYVNFGCFVARIYVNRITLCYCPVIVFLHQPLFYSRLRRCRCSQYAVLLFLFGAIAKIPCVSEFAMIGIAGLNICFY